MQVKMHTVVCVTGLGEVEGERLCFVLVGCLWCGSKCSVVC